VTHSGDLPMFLGSALSPECLGLDVILELNCLTIIFIYFITFVYFVYTDDILQIKI